MKKLLIKTLKYLNNKPLFGRIFFAIHKMRDDSLNTEKFISAVMPEGHLLGCYDHRIQKTWQRMVEHGFEPKEQNFIKNINADVFIDIGTHIGYYTCLLAKKNPKMKVLSFEPNKNNLLSLRKNIEINNLNNVQVFDCALSNYTGKTILYGKEAGGSILLETYSVTPYYKQEVRVDMLDNYVSFIPKNAKVFIKIDVEGGEYNILLGAEKFIKTIKPEGFLLEICTEWSGGKNPKFKETFDLMKNFGYTYKTLGENYLFEKKNS